MSMLSARLKGALVVLILYSIMVPQTCGSPDIIPGTDRAPGIFQSAQYGLASRESWNRIYDTPVNDSGLGIVFDDNANLYVVGSAGDDALFLKYVTGGSLLWNRTWGGSGNERARRVVVDSAGSVYGVGSTTSYGNGGSDGVLLKYSTDGNLLWYRTWGGSANDTGNNISLTREDLILVCGTVSTAAGNETDAYVGCLDADGTLVWNATWGESYQQEAWDVVCSNDGIYVAGSTLLSVDEDRDLQVTGLSMNGTLRWTREWSRSGDDAGYALDMTQSGIIAVTGYSESGEPLPEYTVFVPYLEYTEDGDLVTDGSLDLSFVEAESDVVALDMSLSEHDDRYVIGTTGSGFFIDARSAGGGGFGIQAMAESGSSIALGSNVTMAFVGTSSLSFTTDFVFLQHFDWEWGPDSYPTYGAFDYLWQYSSDGVVEPLGTGQFTSDSTRSIITRLYTVQSEWLEIVHDGSLLWSFVPDEQCSSLRAETCQLDSDIYSELVVQYTRLESNDTSVITLDHDGREIWNWTGILTSTKLHVSDMNGDSLSEVVLETPTGVLLLDSQRSQIWTIGNTETMRYRVHGFGDYDLDGQPDLVLSQASSNQSESCANCSVVDHDDNVLLRFPLPWIGKGNVMLTAHDAVRIDMISLVGSASPEFYCAAVVNQTEVAEFIVDHDGQSILWKLPWTPGNNLTAYEQAEVRFCDLNRDFDYEILRKSHHGSTFALRGDGTIMWARYLPGRILGSDPSSDIMRLVDLQGTHVYSIITGDSPVYVIDPLTGDIVLVDDMYEYNVSLCENLDTDPIAEYIAGDINQLVVVRHHGDWQYPDSNQGYWILIIPLFLGPSIVAALVLFWVRKAGQKTSSEQLPPCVRARQLLVLARRSTIAT